MTEFTSSCDKPYDRHEYKITFANGREQYFGDYETMRLFWFTHFQVCTMVCSVVDKKKKKTKLGFA